MDIDFNAEMAGYLDQSGWLGEMERAAAAAAAAVAVEHGLEDLLPMVARDVFESYFIAEEMIDRGEFGGMANLILIAHPGVVHEWHSQPVSEFIQGQVGSGGMGSEGMFEARMACASVIVGVSERIRGEMAAWAISRRERGQLGACVGPGSGKGIGSEGAGWLARAL